MTDAEFPWENDVKGVGAGEGVVAAPMPAI
jgi:hypothetical protein